MAGNLSTVAEALLSKFMFSDSSVTRPASWELALYTAAPDDSGGGTEISTSATGYARQPITFGADGVLSDIDAIFGPSLTSWGTITHGAVFDGDNGRFLSWAALNAPQTIGGGTRVTLVAGSVTTAFD